MLQSRLVQRRWAWDLLVSSNRCCSLHQPPSSSISQVNALLHRSFHTFNTPRSTRLAAIQRNVEQAAQGNGFVKQQRLLLVDMFAEAFRIHHGFGDNRLMSSRGEDTTVLYGILSNLCMLLLTDPRPTHVALVQDAPGKTFRHELYQGYKGHREEPPETVSKGVECATDVLHALGVRVLRIPGVEADDVIASLACRAAAEGVEVDIVSGDKDFFQILRPNVRLLRARRRTAQQQQATSSSGPRYKAYSDVDFMQQYPGLTPAQWVDYLALKGDAVDNVPGVRGIGDKSALQLLQAHRSIDGIFANMTADDAVPKRAKNALQATGAEAAARLSRRLVELRVDLDVPQLHFGLDELAVRRPADGGALARSMLARWDVVHLDKSVQACFLL